MGIYLNLISSVWLETSLLQCLHFIASLRIDSAQNGHFLYSPDSPCTTASLSDVDVESAITSPINGDKNATNPAINPLPCVIFDVTITRPNATAQITTKYKTPIPTPFLLPATTLTTIDARPKSIKPKIGSTFLSP